MKILTLFLLVFPRLCYGSQASEAYDKAVALLDRGGSCVEAAPYLEEAVALQGPEETPEDRLECLQLLGSCAPNTAA